MNCREGDTQADRPLEDALLNDWHVVATSEEVVPGKLVPTMLFGRELVAWRDTAGQAYVWEDLCIHRGARLSKGFIQSDRVVCPYHGWNYAGYRALENFIDPTHFPFVHAGVNGIMDQPDPIGPYDVFEKNGGLATSEVQVTQPYGDPREVPVMAYYAYQCLRPLVAYFKKRVVITDPERASEGSDEDRFCTFFTAQQVDETRSIVRICCAMNFSPQPTDADVRRRQDLVYAQDSAIVNTQRPERIPVDLRMELHHRTDLLGQKYRMWLRNMGVSYGTV